jgi:hypothetical protein
MLLALLILGIASYSSLKAAMKHSGHTSRVFEAVSGKTRVPKLMGMLVLGMQAGQLANHKEHFSIVTLLAVVFGATIWGAMRMRSGVEHELL